VLGLRKKGAAVGLVSWRKKNGSWVCRVLGDGGRRRLSHGWEKGAAEREDLWRGSWFVAIVGVL
jgi:hypothetical protein